MFAQAVAERDDDARLRRRVTRARAATETARRLQASDAPIVSHG